MDKKATTPLDTQKKQPKPPTKDEDPRFMRGIAEPTTKK